MQNMFEYGLLSANPRGRFLSQAGSPKRVGDDDQTAAMAVTEGTLEVRRSINGPVASGRW